MQIIQDLSEIQLEQETIVTIGAFDGIHVGHQAILQQLVKRVKKCGDCLSAMVTFEPHPRTVLDTASEPDLLTTLDEKITLLGHFDLDLLILLPFNQELADTSAPDFVRRLKHELQMRELWVGPNFRLGKDRQGGPERLQKLGQEMGFALHIIEPLIQDGQMISSTYIRQLLSKGDVAQAQRWLGRPYSLSGEIVHGAGRGQKMGFPTANVAPPLSKLVPANGVYVACASLNKQPEPVYHTVVNIGVRPSFDNGHRTIEAHILDFDADIYGQVLTLRFLQMLRGERHFDSVETLIAQIKEDCREARQVFCTPDYALPNPAS
jgi:riboflavin kinase/FMN adenylyltransferase